MPREDIKYKTGNKIFTFYSDPTCEHTLTAFHQLAS